MSKNPGVGDGGGGASTGVGRAQGGHTEKASPTKLINKGDRHWRASVRGDLN